MSQRSDEEIGISDFVDDEQNKYVIEQLVMLCSILGVSYKEDEILDYVESEIKKISEERNEELKIVKDPRNFGLYVHVPTNPLSQPQEIRKTILFDSHIDQVSEEMMKPRITSYLDYKKGTRHLINATALDNRISCAVMLGLIKFSRCRSKDFICLFSVQEEVGKKGIEFFGDNINLFNDFPKLKKIFVLDVTNGLFPGEKEEIKNPKSKKNFFPVIGDGKIDRSRNVQNPLLEKSLTNMIRFEESKFYGKSNLSYQLLGVPISGMHEVSSFCCVEDVLKLFRHLKNIHLL